MRELGIRARRLLEDLRREALGDPLTGAAVPEPAMRPGRRPP